MMKKVYISVGSNLGDRKANLENSYHLIESETGRIINKSSVYCTSPWGFEAENDFYNAVIIIETNLSVDELMNKLQSIEKVIGRIKTGKTGYESRLIDLDIIDYNGEEIQMEDLIVPHPGMTERNFVLIPLAEVDSTWRHPKLKHTAKQLIKITKDKLRVIKID